MKKLLFLFLLAVGTLRAQVAVAPLQLVRQQFLSATGVPLAGGCINFFATGTSTPQAIYADSTGTFQLANPLTLDAAGEASVWMSNTGYDIVANTGVNGTACSVALGTQLWRENNKNPFSIINGGSNYIVASAFRSDIPCLRFFIATWDCIVELTLPQTVTNKTLDISANTLKNSTNIAGHYPRNNGTQYADSTLVASDAQSTYVNEAVTGTATNRLAQLTGIGTVNFPGTAVTSGIIGICVSGCGLSGSAQVASGGILSCSFDGATTANDYVQISSISAGSCHDAGAGFPVNSNQVLGRVLSTNGGSGVYQMDFFSPEIKAPVSTTIPVFPINLTAQAANITAGTITTPGANGLFRISCYLVVTQAATTSSTLPQCNALFTDADSSTAESVALSNTNTANTLGTLALGITSLNSFFAKSGSVIQYSTTGYTSVGATPMQYAVHIRLEGPF